MTYHHGVLVTEETTGTRPIDEVSISVIGMVATAADADADVFPLDTPVLIEDIRRAIGSAGTEGTLAKALTDISNQTSPIMVVVRVADDTDAAVIGGTVGNAYTGMQALLAAEAQLKVRPRILGAPGLDSLPVATALVTLAQKLRGMAYVFARGAADESAAIDFRDEFAAREIMVIWPDFSGWDGQAIAVALGTRARLDEEQGPQKSISNVPVNGVTGLSHDVFFDLQDPSTAAGLLNSNEVTTLVHRTGYRFWGSRTCADDPAFAFEPAVRMNYLLQDTLAAGVLWALDKPLTVSLVRDIEETINAEIRKLVNAGQLIGGSCWYDSARNAQEELQNGGVTLSYDFTVPAPAERIGLISKITGDYYADFAKLLG